MPVSDDDYKKRLARRISTGGSLGPNIPTSMIPYQATATPISRADFLTSQPPGTPQFMPGPPAGAIGGIARAGAEEFSPLFSRIATPILKRAIETARMEGQQIGGSILEQATSQGVRYPHSGVVRAGKAAEDELFNFISELERMGVRPQTANRLLKGFSEYADDPFTAMETLGANLSRSASSGMDAKQALVERILGRLGNAAENGFFG